MIKLTFLPALLVILVVAIAGRLLSERIGQPAILAELIGGMILGGFVILAGPAQEPIDWIAGIGIILLIFLTGLGISFEEMKRLKFDSSAVAASGVALPFVLGFFTASLFGFSRLVSVLVGICLVATSVGFGAEVLREFKMLRTRLGTLVVSAAVIDDVIGIVLIATLVGFMEAGHFSLEWISVTIILTTLFFIISFTVGIRLVKKFSGKVRLREENLLIFGIIVVLVFAFLAEKIHLAPITGAFVAGVLVGQSHFADRLSGLVSLIGEGFFIPIFFVTISMEFDIGAFSSVGLFAAILVVVAIAGKVVGCGSAAKACGFSGTESFAAGAAMIPRAEVSLVLLSSALAHGVIGSNIASAILMMVVVTCLITPSLFGESLKKVRGRGSHDTVQRGLENWKVVK